MATRSIKKKLNDIIGLEAMLSEAYGIKFNDTSLLVEAFTHSSATNEGSAIELNDNARLEFLGDAVIDIVIAESLFAANANLNPGELTAMRSSLVSGDALARIARRLEISQWLSLGQGEESNGGRNRISNLANLFEAFVGALYLDSGYEHTKNWIINIFKKEIETCLENGVVKDHKSTLQELVQKHGGAPPVYSIINETGVAHEKQFEVTVKVGAKILATGKGNKKVAAEQDAAKNAISEVKSG